MTAESAQQRLDQIVRTAHRVRPTDVGVWKSATGTLGPADAVVIAPADLMWLVEQLRTPPDKIQQATIEAFAAMTPAQRRSAVVMPSQSGLRYPPGPEADR